jgi:hypothetical protein
MRSSSLGKQRGNRRSHRNGAVRRFLAALAASVILGIGVGAPIAAAHSPSELPLGNGGGDAGHANLGERDKGPHVPSPTPAVPPPVTMATTAPVPVPVTVPPARVPNGIGPLPAARSGAPVMAPTASLSGASTGFAAVSVANGAAPAAVSPPRAPSSPAAAPATAPRSPVGRALRTARSYGALLALAAAVVVFLLLQGRLDRRDPRILSAPAEDDLSFRDFE